MIRTKPAARVKGLPAGFRYHHLRHYVARLLMASGGAVKTVQAGLRHASAKTTLHIYVHIWPDRDQSTRTALDALLAAKFENSADFCGLTTRGG
jgi:integrase